MSEADVLINYMPIVVRSGSVNDWERKFCASIIHKSRSARFVATQKQIATMQRIVRKFQDENMRDPEVLEAGSDAGR